MRSVSIEYANKLLATKFLTVGEWAEIKDLGGRTHGAKLEIPESPIGLFRVASVLADWSRAEDWTLLQFDNSNSFDHEEVEILKRILFTPDGAQWNWATEGTLIFERSALGQESSHRASLLLAIHMALVLSWHLYVVSDRFAPGGRLGLLDGIAYCFASEPDVIELRRRIGS